MDAQPEPMPGAVRAYAYLGTLVAAHVGVYLCRKNFAVAAPVLQKTDGPGLTRELEAFNGD